MNFLRIFLAAFLLLMGLIFLFRPNIDRYVITCFLFAFLSVVEYAAVNHFVYKPTPEAKIIGRNIDYFFKYSAGPLWILVVALFFLQHELTQIIMYIFASIWLFSGSVFIGIDIYKATRSSPRCIRFRGYIINVSVAKCGAGGEENARPGLFSLHFALDSALLATCTLY